MTALIILGFISILGLVTVYKGVNIVPQGEEWVVERLGRYHITLEPGLNLVIPYIDSVRKKITTRDIILDVPKQEVITKDNAVIVTNAIAFVKVTNPESAVYGVVDFQEAIRQMVMTTLRSIIGEMALDECLSNREQIKTKLKNDILDDVADWGVTVKSVEIQDINPSSTMQESMEKQASAERDRRAIETKAEGTKNALVLEAEGNKRASILEAEGRLESSERDAKAQIALANASAEAIKLVSENIKDKELPAMFLLGEKYISSLDKISESNNSKLVIYPADLQGAVKGMLGGVFKK